MSLRRFRTGHEEFKRTYCALLHRFEQAFNGSPAMFGAAMGAMYALKGQVRRLPRTPDGDETTAGPTFAHVQPESRR